MTGALRLLDIPPDNYEGMVVQTSDASPGGGQ